MEHLSNYILESIIKNQNDLTDMRFLLIDLKSLSSEKYTIDAFKNVISALKGLDVESSRNTLEKFVKDANTSAIMINQQYILCKIGKSDIQNINIKSIDSNSSDILG